LAALAVGSPESGKTHGYPVRRTGYRNTYEFPIRGATYRSIFGVSAKRFEFMKNESARIAQVVLVSASPIASVHATLEMLIQTANAFADQRLGESYRQLL